MDSRIGVVAILVEDRQQAAPRVNGLLADYAELVMGRIGLPYRERNLHIIALIVQGTTDEIGALTGKLGMLEGVRTRALLLTR